MLHKYVKQLKQGELAEGEYPYMVVRLSDELLEGLLEQERNLLANGYEEADGSEYDHMYDYLKKAEPQVDPQDCGGE